MRLADRAIVSVQNTVALPDVTLTLAEIFA